MRALAIKTPMELISVPRPEPGPGDLMRASGEQLAKITALVDDGVIKPVLDKTFSLDGAAEAISYVESGRAVGKVVIRVADQAPLGTDRFLM